MQGLCRLKESAIRLSTPPLARHETPPDCNSSDARSLPQKRRIKLKKGTQSLGSPHSCLYNTKCPLIPPWERQLPMDMS